MNSWLAFALGIATGFAFGLYGTCLLVAAAIGSTATDQPDEVVERLEAQRGSAPWN